MREWIVTVEAAPAVQVPYGSPHQLPAGSRVRVTQDLGNSITVETDTGYLLRLAGSERPALGLPSAPVEQPSEGPVNAERVWELLRQVYDPEIPINVVELGLIYDVQVGPLEDGLRIDVQMTVTAPGCGMGDVLKQEIEMQLAALPKVKAVAVELVLDPPWDPSRMSEAARLEAGLF